MYASFFVTFSKGLWVCPGPLGWELMALVCFRGRAERDVGSEDVTGRVGMFCGD